MDLANPLIMGQMAETTNVLPSVQNAIFGEQQRQQNANNLLLQGQKVDQAQREERARQAAAQIAQTPDLDEATFETLLKPIAEADPAAAQSMRAQRRMSADLSSVLANPNARSIGMFSMRYPEFGKQISDAFGTMSEGERQSAFRTANDVYGYLQAGDAGGAEKVLNAHIAADKAAGMDTTAYEPLVDLIRQDPKRAMFVAGTLMAGHVGPDKFGDTFDKVSSNRRADELQPAELAKAGAEATIKQTEAAYAPAKMESDLATADAQRQRMAAQTANEREQMKLGWEKLALDKDALETTTALKMQEMQNQAGVLDSGATTEVNKAVNESMTSQALANRMNDLADRISGTNMGWGWASAAREQWKGAFGGQDPVTALRSEYQTLINSQAVKNLPPGPASDKDIQLAKQGFPPPTASGEYLQSFLRGMAKIQTLSAEAADRKANWIAKNKSLGPARGDIEVAGVMVPAGTTFTEFNNNAVKVGKQGETPASLSSIIQKYGRR